MGSDEAQQSLLSESRDHSLLNEKGDLQRRRPRRGSASETEINLQDKNVVQNLSHLQSISATKLEAEFHFKPVFLCLAAYLGAGTLCFYFTSYQIKGIKTIRFLDAIYFCVVTMTTVGYGDLVPNSSFAKLLACIYVFTGMALVGLILSKAADYIVEKQEVLLVRAINKGRKLGLAELSQEVENHKAKYKFMVAAATFIVLMIVGTIFLYFVENLDFMDAFYCVCATITTLGYGDESFSTAIGRTFAVFWILSSTICLAQFFAYLAELYAEGRQKSLAKMVLTRKLSPSDLEAADLDGDRVISAAEFIVYKLKEMGKISQEDISDMMESFRKLDQDQSGTLTEADLR
ncbi:hypothetical protein Lal_00006586 [Lupinus albus]|uniref:Putative flagellar calcium-binding protein calflagin n=1 Tax=Lupinus albus TaxID=3870 RepID=A0A6A4Q6E9_LUPAL|nr:putative flagellar calcium-binding protein calflagin [Lupinus albus]KAF1875955.1 hypothetical protein Lal_00006586 [Lupinus albus]